MGLKEISGGGEEWGGGGGGKGIMRGKPGAEGSK